MATTQKEIVLTMNAVDVLAALRVAAMQAHREGMPFTAGRHEEDGLALDNALDEYDPAHISIRFYS